MVAAKFTEGVVRHLPLAIPLDAVAIRVERLRQQPLLGAAFLLQPVKYFEQPIQRAVDLAISFSVLLALMLWDGVAFSAQLLFVPLFVFGTLLAAAAVGTFLSARSVAYRDFRYVIPFLIQIWMFASPVAYPFSVVPEKWRSLYALNPMVGMLSGFRSAVLNEPFHCGPIAVSSLVIVVFAVVAAFYFRRVERRLADIV